MWSAAVEPILLQIALLGSSPRRVKEFIRPCEDELSPTDNQAVRMIPASWSKRQAVANLLFHPRLMPTDLRIASLCCLRHSLLIKQPFFDRAARRTSSAPPRQIP